MATVNVIHTVNFLDAKGSRASLPLYAHIDDSATIPLLLAGMSAMVSAVDNITEAQILSHSITLLGTNPVGLKAAPVVNSDVEEGALFSFSLNGLPSKSMGYEIPAFVQAYFSGKEVNLSEQDVIDFITQMTQAGTFNIKNNVWSNSLLAPPRKAYKSFRK